MIYQFRVLLDAEEDVIRDIEISGECTLEDLHQAIIRAFEFEGQEMAAFYQSNSQWEQGQEIPLIDMRMEKQDNSMQQHTIQDTVVIESKLLYIYDFLALWTFLVECVGIVKKKSGKKYPQILFTHGKRPEKAPDKQFESGTQPDFLDTENDFEFDDYNSLDFEENWN